MLSSQGMAMALATAMVLTALSGTAIVISAFCFHKSHSQASQPTALRSSCISSEVGKKKTKRPGRRVKFAEDDAEMLINSGKRISEELKREKRVYMQSQRGSPSPSPPSSFELKNVNGGGIPANRVALYNGILRDRLVQRMAYSQL